MRLSSRFWGAWERTYRDLRGGSQSSSLPQRGAALWPLDLGESA